MEPLDDDVTPTPIERPGPRKSSQQSFTFAEMCEAAASVYSGWRTILGNALAQESRELAVEFRLWHSDPPASERRNARIKRMQELCVGAHKKVDRSE